MSLAKKQCIVFVGILKEDEEAVAMVAKVVVLVVAAEAKYRTLYRDGKRTIANNDPGLAF